MRTRFSFTGGRELKRALGQLPKATGKAVQRRTLTKAAQPIVNAMEANAPELTGHLAGVIDDSFSLTARQRRATGGGAQRQADGSFRSARSTGQQIHIGPTTDAENKRAPDPAGLMNEFGNANMEPQPFVGPAWDAEKDNALEIIKTELGREIEKAAARQAKKRG